MNVVQFDRGKRRRRRQVPRSNIAPLIALVILAGVLALVWLSLDRPLPGDATVPRLENDAREVIARFSMCGWNRDACVVDGDTIWWQGQNLRMESYDTPEAYEGICGGSAEVALANRASSRLLQLLNSNPFTVETFDVDATGERTRATIRIAGRDVGDILIEEGLARRWPDGDEFWC
jgi:endonuclease YncB( thermonuclease family)